MQRLGLRSHCVTQSFRGTLGLADSGTLRHRYPCAPRSLLDHRDVWSQWKDATLSRLPPVSQAGSASSPSTKAPPSPHRTEFHAANEQGRRPPAEGGAQYAAKKEPNPPFCSQRRALPRPHGQPPFCSKQAATFLVPTGSHPSGSHRQPLFRPPQGFSLHRHAFGSGYQKDARELRQVGGTCGHLSRYLYRNLLCF